MAKDDTTVALTEDQLNEVSKLNRVSDEELRSITSFDDAMRFAAETYGSVEDLSTELGNGFNLISDKNALVGKKMVVIAVGFNDGDYGRFVSVACVTHDNKKYIFNDGSAGIRDQFQELVMRTNRHGGWTVAKGLRRSDYEYQTSTGDLVPAATFYLDTSTD
jgi:hypothetical protein